MLSQKYFDTLPSGYNRKVLEEKRNNASNDILRLKKEADLQPVDKMFEFLEGKMITLIENHYSSSKHIPIKEKLKKIMHLSILIAQKELSNYMKIVPGCVEDLSKLKFSDESIDQFIASSRL